MAIKDNISQPSSPGSHPDGRHGIGNEPVNFIRQGSGDPVILIHGLAASFYDWDALVPELAANGYDACALDLLGHGDSFKPQQVVDYNVHSVYSHLREWIDSLFPDEPAFLIGHSLGGYLALLHALRDPHNVKGLVLVNPYFSIQQMSTFLQMVFRYPLFNTALIERTPYWLFRIIIDLSSLEQGRKKTQRHSLPEEIRKQTALDYKRAAPGIYNIPRTMIELGEQLQEMTIPTLMICGTQDSTLDPKSFSDLVKLLPNITYIPMPNSAHVPHQSDAATFNPLVLNFLNEHR